MANYDNEVEETEVVETTEEHEVVEVEDEPEEEAIDWEARAKKAEDTIRKAKDKAKVKPAVEKTEPSTLTTKDLYALMEAKVPQEDISDIEEYANFKGISVTEALKSGTIKTILAQKEEERRVAAGTNTGTTRRGTSKVTDEQLVNQSKKGEMPESIEEIQRLNRLRWGLK